MLVIKRLSRENEKMSSKKTEARAIGFNVRIEPKSIFKMIKFIAKHCAP